MTLDLDEYAHLDSPLHRWEPRCKLIALVALMFAFACVKDLLLLPPMLGIVALLYGLSRLPLSFLRRRLRYPGIFLLGVVALLPFLSGPTVIWQWGAIALRQEGCLAVVLIAGRFLSIFTTAVILLATTPFLKTVKAMRSLGLPAILSDMLLLSYRYLYDAAGNLATMQQAMRLRGFAPHQRSHQRSYQRSAKFWFMPNLNTLRLLASLAGTLLIRSYEQSERVYKAMRLRGYGYEPPTPSAAAAVPQLRLAGVFLADALALGGVLLIAAGFVVAEVFSSLS